MERGGAGAEGGVASQVAGRIDLRSPVPLYYQLAILIEEAIDRGDLPPGSRLDNEVDLARNLTLSRPTVRRALGYLVDHGRLVRRRGIGTMVLPAAVRRTVGLTGLYDDLVRSGLHPTTRVLTLEVGECSEEAAEALELEAGTSVLRIRRLRLVDDQPLAVMENVLPARLLDIDRADLEREGLYRLFAASGIQPRFASQSVAARLADPDEAALLDVHAGSALLALRRVSFDPTGSAIELANHAYVAERYAIEMTLQSEER